MPIFGDSLMFLVHNYSVNSYCRILSVNEEKSEALVLVDGNHRFLKNNRINIHTNDDARGMLYYEGSIQEAYADRLVIRNFRLFNENQRRNDVRVRLNAFLEIEGVAVGNAMKETEGRVTVQTVNISAGGVLLKTELDLADEGACLIFELPLEQKKLGCKARIERKQSVNNCFYYGCKFLNNESQKAEIRRYVFRKQLETRKRFSRLR